MPSSRNTARWQTNSALSDLDVHRTTGRNSRAVPFVVVVQSNRFTASARRVVVPFVAAAAFGQPASDFGPHLMIDGQHDPLQITNIPRDILDPPALAIAGDDSRIINAMDALVSRAWR